MGDYDLNRLEPGSFEQLVQALAVKVLGPETIIFGAGPDGGREATHEGKLAYPSSGRKWSGYVVLQAKFRQRPEGTEKDGKWVLQMLEEELAEFADASKQRRKPDYYIFATNVVLSPKALTGAKDKARALIKKYAKKVPLKDFALWDRDQLRAFLDAHEDVRNAYWHFVTPGDVLAKVAARIGTPPEFAEVIANFLEKELIADQYAHLGQAGHSTNTPISLAPVFVDVPYKDPRRAPASVSSSSGPKLLASLVEAGDQLSSRELPTRTGSLRLVARRRFVALGGPGQGKTTLGQFLCQLYRAALLEGRDRPLSPAGQRVLEQIQASRTVEQLPHPQLRRFPVRVVLSQFAAQLTRDPELTLLRFIVERISKRTDQELSPNDLRRWLREYPWIVILDGLDEVPASSNRARLLQVVSDFTVDLSQSRADVLLIATTRPQGYSEELPPSEYEHLELAPLSSEDALHYAERLVSARYGHEPDRRDEILGRLRDACTNETTARLMQTPLQVTIMAALLESLRQPPQDRWQLFKRYYDVIYSREMERPIQAAELLRLHKVDVDAIHHEVGLRLQVASERAGRTDAHLTRDELSTLVEARLASEGNKGSALQRLRDLLIEAAFDRLVFLVGLSLDRVGFELRSFQEFMAAERLMTGEDLQVLKRLDHLAPLPYWRNVVIFAVGKLLLERQHLRADLVVLCEALNDDPEDDLARALLTGSRLALEILQDGTVRRQPKYGRSLFRNAFKLLAPGFRGASSDFAGMYDEAYKDLFEDELGTRLRSQAPEVRQDALLVLVALEQRGITWASELLDREWPSSEEQQVELFHYSDDFGPKHTDRLQKLVVRTDLVTLDALGDLMFRLESPSPSAERFFEWLYLVISEEPRPGRDRVSLSLHGRALGVAFYLQRCHEQALIAARALKPDDFPRWTLFRAAANFSADPTPFVLAQSLEEIAAAWEEPSIRLWQRRLPWPLGVCLVHCESPASARELLARRAEAGELGAAADWKAAEQRWFRDGITEEDLAAAVSGRLNLSAALARRGFVFEAAEFGLENPYMISDEAVVSLLPVMSALPSHTELGDPRSGFVDALRFLGPRRDVMPPEQFRRLVAPLTRVSLDALKSLSWDARLSSQILQLLEELAPRWEISGSYPVEDIADELVRVIEQAYKAHPDRNRLLIPLALALVSATIRGKLSRLDLKLVPRQFNDPMSRAAALLIGFVRRLHGEPGLFDFELIATLGDARPWFTSYALMLLSRLRGGTMYEPALTLLDYLPEAGDKESLRYILMRSLDRRASRLSDGRFAEALGLAPLSPNEPVSA